MTSFYKLCVAAAVGALLAACATSPETENKAAPVNDSRASVQTGGAATGLSPRDLAVNECGLFIWTADARRDFILFAQSQKKEAIFAGENGEQKLTISMQDGVPTEGQYPIQIYNESRFKLELRSPEAIIDGTRYKGGTFTQLNEDKWEKVTPVLGLSICKSS
ncbi:MAG: hypothetical protein ACPGVT_06475 [Maricaulaceae bacterium]